MDNSSKSYQTLLQAASFAARKHEGQRRKDGQTPYVSHVFRVCLIVRDLFGIDDRRILTAALLHDTVEDTTTDFDDIEEQFGADIAHWVALLSKDKRLQEAEREKKYIEQLAGAGWEVKIIKLADMFDNLMDMSTMPSQRHAHTLKRVGQYLECLQQDPSQQLLGPLQRVSRLLGEVAR